MIDLIKLFEGLEITDKAFAAQCEIVKHLEENGFECVTEYRVEYRDDERSGRIDIVAVKGDDKLAIEVDNITPRKKSIGKLKAMKDYQKIVLLRTGYKKYSIDGITVLSLKIKRSD